MYFYFSSDYKAVLKLGGAVLGVISDGVKHCDIDLSATTLVEVCPLIPNQPTHAFLLDDAFCGKIDCGLVTDLKGGYLIKFLHAHTGGEFSVLAQEKLHDGLVTVFNDGGPKITVETPTGFFAESLPFLPKAVSVEGFVSNGQPLYLVTLLGDENLFLVYTASGNVEKVFERRGESCVVQNGILITENLNDMAKHTVETRWEFENGIITQKERKVTAKKCLSPDRLNDNLIPYAFLEELLVGGDYTVFLDQGVCQNAHMLGGYLGEFIGVMPPPFFRDFTEVGLIYKIDDTSFSVEYFSFTISNGKICNLKKTT